MHTPRRVCQEVPRARGHGSQLVRPLVRPGVLHTLQDSNLGYTVLETAALPLS